MVLSLTTKRLCVYNSFENMRLLMNELVCSIKQRLLCLNLKNVSKTTQFLSLRCVSSTVTGEKENKQLDFIERRLNLWNKLKAEYDEKLKGKASQPIKVNVQHGSIYEGLAWQSTPYQIYSEINTKSMRSAIVAKVNNELWDLNRPLENDCDVELLTFEDPAAREVFWHSSAHVLGAAIELVYGSLLKTGPPTENGFFYDVYDPASKVFLTGT